jgi:hypothetical protein
MNRFATTLGIAVGSLSLGFGQGTDLAKDERLAKPVTVQVKLATLPEAMSALGKASGVTMEAPVSLKDYKVTVLVKDQPTHQVMSAIASTLDLQWEADGTTYRIVSNADVASALRKYLDQEDRLRRQDVEAKVKEMAAVANVPYAQAKAKNAQLTPERYLLGQAFLNLGTNGLNAFWTGRTVRNAAPLQEGGASEVTTQGGPPPPVPGPANEEQERQRRRRDGDNRRAFRMIRVSAQYDPIQNRLQTSFEPGRETGGLGIWTAPQGALAESVYGKRILAWPARDDKAEILQKPFTAVKAISDDWYGKRLSAADALEALHKASGVPIVADAFRFAANEGAGSTPAAWLTAFGQANGAYVRTENGFAMVRHGGFWRLRVLDVPERIARPLETAKAPGLEDYAKFAGALTDTQALVYRRPNLVLLKISPEPLRTGIPALRFYASLGNLQQKARQNQAIPYGVMSAQQRNLFLDALDGTFEGGAAIGRGNDLDVSRDANALAFLMTVQDQPDPSNRGTLTLGTRLLFGTAATDGIVYAINVPPKA